jgi:hypothetical protein
VKICTIWPSRRHLHLLVSRLLARDGREGVGRKKGRKGDSDRYTVLTEATWSGLQIFVWP